MSKQLKCAFIIIAFLTMFLVFISASSAMKRYNISKDYEAAEKEVVELSKWIKDSEIVDVDVVHDNSRITRLSITRLNNNIKESKDFSSANFYTENHHESPDDKWHIVEYKGKFIIYTPTTYFNCLSKSNAYSK